MSITPLHDPSVTPSALAGTLLPSVVERLRRYEESGVDETISPHDGMFHAYRRDMHGHYLRAGRSAVVIVALAMIKAGIEEFAVVLDLPCGSGRVLRHLVRFFPEASVVACDIDSDHVEFCARQFGAVPLLSRQDLTQVTLDRPIDLLWCGSLLPHLSADHVKATLCHMVGWLAPGGIAIFTLHGRWSIYRQRDTPYKYVEDETFVPIAEGVTRDGFGYADYPGDIGPRLEGYGLSVSLPHWVMRTVEAIDDVRVLDYMERGWVNHQDVLILRKIPIAARPRIFEPLYDDRAYLDEIRALSFDAREWTPAAVAEMRDFLAPWEHNIRLAPGVFTKYIEDPDPDHEAIMDVVEHHLDGAYAGSRVLDLGCLEGYFSVECALRGLDVLGVDVREVNLKKCEFVKSVLCVSNLRFAVDDVMNVTREHYGAFDVVLALGLLYHLEDPFTFLAQIAELCDGFLVLDTLVALEDAQTINGWQPDLSETRDFAHGGRSYRGRLYREHEEGADELGREFSTTAAYTNDVSIWLTEDSLVALLDDVGFEQLEKVVPARPADWSDPSHGRVLYVATRRRRFSSRVFSP